MSQPQRLQPYILLLGIGLVVGIGIIAIFRTVPSTDVAIIATSTPSMLVLEPLLAGLPAPTQIIPPGQELHDFQPAPSAVGLVQQAKLVVGVGGADEAWLPKVLDLADTPPSAVLMIPTLEGLGQPLLQEVEHDEIGIDPHVWLSPRLMLQFVPSLRDAVIRVYPDQRSVIERNAAAFEQQLRALDTDVATALVSKPQHRFISFHNAFRYFSRDYGLEQVAVIEQIPGQAPTPGEIATIQQAIQTYQLRGLFVEPQFSSALVDQLTKDQGLLLESLDPLETAQAGDTYTSLMRKNLAALERVLGATQ